MRADWGLSMAGCERTILDAVALALDSVGEPTLRYLEIGVAAGDTFARVCSALADSGRPWEAIALDLPEGIEAAENYQRAASCLDLEAFTRNIAPFGQAVRLVRAVSWVWLASQPACGPLGLVLIDGCHERACAAADFLGVEPLVAPGGAVIFHDTAPWSQGDPTQQQPHRGEPLAVRAALEDLRLLQGRRPGWGLRLEADGIEAEGGRGCIVFQRTRMS